MNSRAKGCRGEREASKAWSEVFGVDARRGCQFQGGEDSPDIVTGHSDIHVEVKRVERGNPYAWIDQAVADASANVPVVLHRRNNQPWLLLVRLSDVPRLAKIIAETAEGLGRGEIPGDIPGTSLPPWEGPDELKPGVV